MLLKLFGSIWLRVLCKQVIFGKTGGKIKEEVLTRK